MSRAAGHNLISSRKAKDFKAKEKQKEQRWVDVNNSGGVGSQPLFSLHTDVTTDGKKGFSVERLQEARLDSVAG